MTGARDKSDSQAFDVVHGIAERMDLEFTAVARSGIDVTDAQGATQDVANPLLQLVSDAQRIVGCRLRLGGNSCTTDCMKRLEHELEIVATIGKIERLIDQRKIRHDVSNDRVFEHG